jgi:hypothetical protein
MAKLHYANKLVNLLCNITNEACWALARPAPNKLYNLLALVLPEPNIDHGIASAQQVGQQVGSVEYISQQVVQQVRIWCTRHELVGQQVGNLLANLFV